MAEIAPLPPVFRAVVCTVVPEGRDLDESDWDELEALVRDSLERRPAHLRRRLALFMWLVQWAPLLRYGRPFTALNPTPRSRVLSWLQNHRISLIRIGFWGLRTLAMLGYYGRPAAAKAIGYEPDARGWDARHA